MGDLETGRPSPDSSSRCGHGRSVSQTSLLNAQAFGVSRFPAVSDVERVFFENSTACRIASKFMNLVKRFPLRLTGQL
uniref:hypothetical protein n=1 Tax=Saccharothrix mutabilis TaxID=33921 RepID=UPI0031CE20B1